MYKSVAPTLPNRIRSKISPSLMKRHETMSVTSATRINLVNTGCIYQYDQGVSIIFISSFIYLQWDKCFFCKPIVWSYPHNRIVWITLERFQKCELTVLVQFQQNWLYWKLPFSISWPVSKFNTISTDLSNNRKSCIKNVVTIFWV